MMDQIAISGLSAAGKTTHTLLLAESLGFDTVHFTDLLLAAAGVSHPGPQHQIWFTRLREIEILRERRELDRHVDGLIAGRMRTARRLVVDSMLAPWLGPENTLRIWIGSDRLSRTWKGMVSYLPNRPRSPDEFARHLDEKDGLSRDRFWREHSVDLYSDRSVFDFVLDNSHLIAAPTRAASDRGIEAFHQVMLACARAGLDGDDAPLNRLLEDPVLAPCVVRIGPRLNLPTVRTKARVPSRSL